MDKLLNFFIREPEQEFYVRQLSKLLNKSPTTISNHLKEYRKKQILKSEKKFNHLLFRANTQNQKFKQLKLNHNLNLLTESGLIDYLVKEFNHPEAIILFGSFAKAEDIPQSDIDLLIINPSNKQVDLKDFEKKIQHKIQLFVHSKKEINKMKTTNTNLLNNLINGITLNGFWEVF